LGRALGISPVSIIKELKPEEVKEVATYLQSI